MKFVLKFDMDNAAFDGHNSGYEVSRILGKIAKRALQFNVEPDFTGAVIDANGNNIGKYHVELTADEQQGK